MDRLIASLRSIFSWDVLFFVVIAVFAGLAARNTTLHRLVVSHTSATAGAIQSSQYLLSSLAQVAAVVFSFSLTILFVFSQLQTRYRYPVSYLWRLGISEYLQIASFLLALLLLLTILQTGHYSWTPIALMIFAQSLVALYLFIRNRVRLLSPETFFWESLAASKSKIRA